jgi:hypothetical protein
MSEFRIKPVELKPNKSFMTHQKGHHEPEGDAFSKFKDYKSKINLLFSDLPQEHRFWLQHGESVQNLHELYVSFDGMPDTVYLHHAKRDKNDFVEWIKHVYQDDELAFKLFQAKSRAEAKAAIEERIDELTKVPKHEGDAGFVKELATKFEGQNQKLEEDLVKKKEWLAKKQKELEFFEQKNLEREKMLYGKYRKLETDEQELYGKFRKLQEQEEKLNEALMKERKQVQAESQKIAVERADISKDRQKLDEERKLHNDQHMQAMLLKHQPIYGRLDELMSYATTCLLAKNYKEAHLSMAKVRYYYDSLPADDPRKKEFYGKIVKLRSYINEELNLSPLRNDK